MCSAGAVAWERYTGRTARYLASSAFAVKVGLKGRAFSGAKKSGSRWPCRLCKPNLLLLTNHEHLDRKCVRHLRWRCRKRRCGGSWSGKAGILPQYGSFLLVDAGRVQEFDGDLDDYARWLSRSDAAPSRESASMVVEPARATAQQRRRDGAEQRKALAPLRARQARCEKRLQELASEALALDAQLSPSLYAASERSAD